MTPITFATFNSYFSKRRTFVMSVSQVVISLGITLYPTMVTLLKDSFGFRGCLMVLTAINLNTIVAMLLMHPYEWHAKKVLINGDLLIDSKILSWKFVHLSFDTIFISNLVGPNLWINCILCIGINYI